MDFIDLAKKHYDLFSPTFTGFACDIGWVPLIDEMLDQLHRVAPEARVTVVKEKCDRLVIYVQDKANPRVRDLLRGVEVLTAHQGERV
jgi:hypothetical protein